MDVVFNVNHLGLEGLGGTLVSLLRNCSNCSELRLHFLCSDFYDIDKTNILELLTSENFSGTTEFINFDAKKEFGHLKSLHGDWTTYGRLLIPTLIKSELVLYLDADLIILLDVLTLKNFAFEGHFLGAVLGTTVKWVLDKSFLISKLNQSPDQDYFNAGVLLFNLRAWRELDIETTWKTIAEQYPQELISNDQTLLNAVCRGRFAHLPKTFNTPWYPGNSRPVGEEKSILHFVGSPKPWDLFGRTIHQGYDTWNQFNTPSWNKHYGSLTAEKLKRTWKIKKSLIKHLRDIFKSGH